MADTKLTALSEISIVDFSDDLYIVDNTGPTSNKIGTDRLMGLLGLIPGGRLTTESGVAVSTTDRVAQSTLYYTPRQHNRIRIFDSTRWIYYSFAELSLALSGLTSGKNYDVFVYDNAGTLTLELSAAWTNDTTRADALTTQDAVFVKSGATTRLWLGTIRTTSTTTTEDSIGGTTTQVGGKRFVWNAYQQVAREMRVIDTADSWSYTTDAWRVANGATTPLNGVEMIVGRVGVVVDALFLSIVYIQSNSARKAIVGIGANSGTVPSGFRQSGYNAGADGLFSPVGAAYRGVLALGYSYLVMLERGGDVVSTFVGDDGGGGAQTGLEAWIMG